VRAVADGHGERKELAGAPPQVHGGRRALAAPAIQAGEQELPGVQLALPGRVAAAHEHVLEQELLMELAPLLAQREAVLAGACSVAGWDTSPEQLVALLSAGLESRSILPTLLLQELATSNGNGSTTEQLDEHQVEWLRSLAGGMTVCQLAESICYSEREVYRLLRALYDRLGVRGRTEALIWAAQHGIVE
jgi:DNA-binding CsgD family transcriptional regulator